MGAQPARRRGWLCAFAVWVALAGSTAVRGEVVRDPLYDASVLDGRTAWVVGGYGTIAHTTDGGATWRLQTSGTTESLYGVDFVDAQHGWAVGRSGLLLQTVDGGARWTRLDTGTDKHLFDVDFVDARRGVVVGDWGALLVTENGGQTWNRKVLVRDAEASLFNPDLPWETRTLAPGETLPEGLESKDVILNDVHFATPDVVYVVGEFGSVLRSLDGGHAWSELRPGIDKTLFGVHFSDPQHGWAVGVDGLILATDDGGASWNVRHGSLDAMALDQVQSAQTYENPSLYGVAVAGSHGLAVGEIGAVFRTDDGGRTWTRERTPQEWALSWLRDVALTPDANGLAVGAAGLRVVVDAGRIHVDE